ncbi:MAG: polysaccharide biosynthesis/export family protein [Bacteroidales bacterium]
MKKLALFIFLSLLITSCKVFSPSQMLRTGPGYKYSKFLASDSVQEYRIAPFDKISFYISPNNGEKLLDQVAASANTNVNTNTNAGTSYTIEYDGSVKFPVFGRIKLSGYTVREAEKMLEDRYSKFYNNPFVKLEVTNMRVILFSKGLSGPASVISLANPNTTLFEALASAGGVFGGKSYNIKLIRGDLINPQIYLIDLSTLEGMKKANLILQTNDIIIIRPRNNISERAMTFVTPYLSLMSFILLILQTVK